MNDQEINERIDAIQARADGLTAEQRNALHACRPGHPLGKGKDRFNLFFNAAFVLFSRPGVTSDDIAWLRRMAFKD